MLKQPQPPSSGPNKRRTTVYLTTIRNNNMDASARAGLTTMPSPLKPPASTNTNGSNSLEASFNSKTPNQFSVQTPQFTALRGGNNNNNNSITHHHSPRNQKHIITEVDILKAQEDKYSLLDEDENSEFNFKKSKRSASDKPSRTDVVVVASSKPSTPRNLCSDLTHEINGQYRNHYKKFETAFSDKLKREYDEMMDARRREEREFLSDLNVGGDQKSTKSNKTVNNTNSSNSGGKANLKKSGSKTARVEPHYAQAKSKSRRKRGRFNVNSKSSQNGEDEDDNQNDHQHRLHLDASVSSFTSGGNLSPTSTNINDNAEGSNTTNNNETAQNSPKTTKSSNKNDDDEFGFFSSKHSGGNQNDNNGSRGGTPRFSDRNNILRRNIALVCHWKPEPIKRIYGQEPRQKDHTSFGGVKKNSSDDDGVGEKYHYSLPALQNFKENYRKERFLMNTSASPRNYHHSNNQGDNTNNNPDESVVVDEETVLSFASGRRICGGGAPPSQQQIEQRHQHADRVKQNRRELETRRRSMLMNSTTERHEHFQNEARHLVVLSDDENDELENQTRNHHLTTFKDSFFPPSYQELRHTKKAHDKKVYKAWKTAVCVVDVMKTWIDAAKERERMDNNYGNNNNNNNNNNTVPANTVTTINNVNNNDDGSSSDNINDATGNNDDERDNQFNNNNNNINMS